LYNAPANWFAENERSYATMIGTCSTFLGISVGFIVPAIFVSEYDVTKTYTQAEIDSFRAEVVSMFVWISIWSTAVSLLVLLFFKDKPIKPSGLLENASFQGQIERKYETSTKLALKKLMSNSNFVLAAIAVGLMIMFTYLVSTVTGQVVFSYGWRDEHLVSVLGTCFNDFGIVGSVLWAAVVSRKQKQGSSIAVLRKAALLSMWLSFFAWVYFIFAVSVLGRLHMVIS
jgi:hypothetical protein